MCSGGFSSCGQSSLKSASIDLDQKNIDLFNLVRKRDINIKAAISSGNFRKKIYFYHSKSAINTIEKKISNGLDIIGRKDSFKRIELSDKFPKFILENKKNLKDWIID